MKQPEYLCPMCGFQLIHTTKHKMWDNPKHFKYYKCIECGKRWCEEK